MLSLQVLTNEALDDVNCSVESVAGSEAPRSRTAVDPLASRRRITSPSYAAGWPARLAGHSMRVHWTLLASGPRRDGSPCSVKSLLALFSSSWLILSIPRSCL